MEKRHIIETAQACAAKAQSAVEKLDANSRQQKAVIDLANTVTALADCVTHLAGGSTEVPLAGQGEAGDESPAHTHPAAGGDGYEAPAPRADESVSGLVTVFTDRGGTEWGYVLDAEAQATQPYRKPQDGEWEEVPKSDALPSGLLEAMGNALDIE